jgi:hypothetical protein
MTTSSQLFLNNQRASAYTQKKNDTRIELSGKWVEVAREDMVGDSTVFYLSNVRKILGQNDELYGYIVYSDKDNAFIKIINTKTVELIYVHQVQEAR